MYITSRAWTSVTYFLLLNRPHLLKVPLPPQIGPPQRNKCLEQGPGRETLPLHTIPHIVGLTNQGAGASSSAGLPRIHRKKIPYPGRLRPLGKLKRAPATVLSPGLKRAARCGLAFAAVTRAYKVAEFSFHERFCLSRTEWNPIVLHILQVLAIQTLTVLQPWESWR